MFVFARLIGTLAVLVPVLLATHEPLWPARGERLGIAWVGLLQVAGFLICGIIGLAIVPAGRAIVLAFTMPLWAIPIGRSGLSRSGYGYGANRSVAGNSLARYSVLLG
jgi:drug/metabolite transporter (DMT)-like permease